jgi:hypothetical protein
MSTDQGELEKTTSLMAGLDVSTPFPVPEALPEAIGEPEAGPLVVRVDRPPAGRDPETGHFLPGNRLGVGNPLASKAAKLRAALFRAVGQGDMQGIVKALVRKAANGDTAAAKLVLQYTLGEPESIDLIQTVARLEAVILRGVT